MTHSMRRLVCEYPPVLSPYKGRREVVERVVCEACQGFMRLIWYFGGDSEGFGSNDLYQCEQCKTVVMNP